MPTTQPLDHGDDAEGQLKPIAAFRNVSAPSVATKSATPQSVAAKQTTAQPATAPTTQVAPQYATPVEQKVTIGGGRTTIHAPSLSMRQFGKKKEDAKPVTPVEQHRASQFTDAAMLAAWQRYIDDHHAEVFLVNTMRSAVPHADDNDAPEMAHTARTYNIVVANSIQVSELQERMPEIRQALCNALDNDNITFNISVSDGPSSPATWNDAEVLDYMLKKRPELKDFLKTLHLSRF